MRKSDGKVELVLVDYPYSSRRIRVCDDVDYDVFRSSNTKDMVGVLRGVIKLGAHVNLFSIALQFALWSKVLFLESR